MDWQDLRRRYVSILSDMGFRPEVDSDGDIHFTYEGGHYFITNNCDDTYFHMLYPGFWRLESKDEQLAALLAANGANRQVKSAKVLLNSEMSRVGATIECLIAEPSDVRSFLMRALRCMQLAVKTFKEEMQDMLDSR